MARRHGFRILTDKYRARKDAGSPMARSPSMSTRRRATNAAVDTAQSTLYAVILLIWDTVWRVRQATSRVVWRHDGGKHGVPLGHLTACMSLPCAMAARDGPTWERQFRGISLVRHL